MGALPQGVSGAEELQRRRHQGFRAMMDKEGALLYVILPKGASSSSSSIMDKQKEQQPGSSQPHGEQKEGAGSADGSSSSSTGSLWSAQEDAEDRIEERKMELEEMKEKRQEEIATQDVPGLTVVVMQMLSKKKTVRARARDGGGRLGPCMLLDLFSSLDW